MPPLLHECTLPVTSGAVPAQERLGPDPSFLGCYPVSKYGEGLSDWWSPGCVTAPEAWKTEDQPVFELSQSLFGYISIFRSNFPKLPLTPSQQKFPNADRVEMLCVQTNGKCPLLQLNWTECQLGHWAWRGSGEEGRNLYCQALDTTQIWLTHCKPYFPVFPIRKSGFWEIVF